MPYESVLLALAEVSVAFVGFSALVIVFRNQERRELEGPDAERVKSLIGTGLGALLFSTLPFAFLAFDASLTTTWRVGSGLQAFVHLAGSARSVVTARRLRQPVGPLDFLVVAAGGGVVAMLALNAASLGFPGSFGPYLVGVMWMLSVSAYMLIGLVTTRPAR